MKKIDFILYEIIIILLEIKNENIDYLTEGYYEIYSSLNNLYLSLKSKKLIISDIKFSFNIIPISKFSYVIKYRNEKIGIDDNNKIILYNNIQNIDIKKYSWNFYNIKRNQYLIKNEYNNKLIEVSDKYIKISNNYNNDKKYIFTFFKVFERGFEQKKYKKIITSQIEILIFKYFQFEIVSILNNHLWKGDEIRN